MKPDFEGVSMEWPATTDASWHKHALNPSLTDRLVVGEALPGEIAAAYPEALIIYDVHVKKRS